MTKLGILCTFALLGACSTNDAVWRLENTKWGNDAKPCSEVYATFNNGVIATHANGNTLPMWEISNISRSWLSPQDVDVQIKLPPEVQKSLDENERANITNFFERGFELNLRLEGDWISIKSVTVAGVKQPVKGDFTMFNMFACEGLS